MAKKNSFGEELKKDLSKAEEHPAEMFITKPEEKAASAGAGAEGRKRRVYTGTRQTLEAPDGYKVNPLYIEKKTRRIQLILQPSIYERAKDMADALGLSFNEYVHRALDEITAADAEELKNRETDNSTGE